MDILQVLRDLFGQTPIPPPQCVFEVRVGGMLTNFGPTIMNATDLEYLRWIYAADDPTAEVFLTCFSFLV